MTSGRAVAQALRFLAAGALNTGLTYMLYLLLLQAFAYAVSYSVAFVVGIGLSYLLNRWFVFQAGGGRRTMALYPLVYVAQHRS